MGQTPKKTLHDTWLLQPHFSLAVKNIVSETLLEMAEEEEADLLEADLKTILIITGSYLYSGADLTDIEDSVFARINELAVKHLVEQENQVPSGVTIQ